MASYSELLDDLVALQQSDEAPADDHDAVYAEATAQDLVLVGDVDGLRLWLNTNPKLSVNARDPQTGRSLLHQASADGHKDIVKLLLERTEANITLRTMLGGSTALHLAVTNNHRSIVFQLLSHGADALARDKFGCSPMHYVKSVSVAKLLVSYGGQVLDYNARRKSAIDNVAFLRELDDDNQASTDDPAWKELLKFLKLTAEVEYKAKLAKLRELKQQAKTQQDELTKRKRGRRKLSSQSQS